MNKYKSFESLIGRFKAPDKEIILPHYGPTNYTKYIHLIRSGLGLAYGNPKYLAIIIPREHIEHINNNKLNIDEKLSHTPDFDGVFITRCGLELPSKGLSFYKKTLDEVNAEIDLQVGKGKKIIIGNIEFDFSLYYKALTQLINFGATEFNFILNINLRPTLEVTTNIDNLCCLINS